jgi:lysophospholipase L1-like esterase
VQGDNAASPALVSSSKTAGKHVVLLDNYAAFSNDSSCRTTVISDYLHPNDAGYVVLGRAMYEAIRTALR